jgi:hypothetical protein
MKIADLEDHDQLVTKDYLDARLAEFRLEIQREFQQVRRELSEQFKWNIGLIFGLYAIIILGHFLK